MPENRQTKSKIISDIATRLNLSRTTVNNVISNNVSVSQEKRDLVEKELKKMGCYESFFTVPGVKSSETVKFVAAIPSIPNHFWNMAVAGITTAMKQYDTHNVDFRLIRYSKVRDISETLRMLDVIDNISPGACLVVPCTSPEIREKLTSLSGKMLTAIIDEPLEYEGCFFSSTGNYRNDGIKAAEIIADFPLAQKNILLIKANVFTSERTEAFIEACKKTPNMNVTFVVSIDEYTRTMSSSLSRTLSSHKNEFNCVYSPSGIFGPVCNAIQKLSLMDSVYVVGHDASPATVKYYEEGLKGAIIKQDIYMQGYMATCVLLEKLLYGKKEHPASMETGYSSEIYL